MTSNLWKNMKLVCGSTEHEEKILQIDTNNGKNLIFYQCPCCHNRIGAPDADRMIEKLDKVLTNACMNAETINLTNFSWKTQKGLFYKVVNHDTSTDSFTVSVFNAQA